MFYIWAMDNGYNDNLTIDRIDNERGYSPDNCRWSTKTGQSINRKSTVFITHKGETLHKSKWAERLGISKDRMLRLSKKFGNDIQKIIDNIDFGKPKKYSINGEALTIKEISLKYNLNKETVADRIKKGYREDEIISKPAMGVKRSNSIKYWSDKK